MKINLWRFAALLCLVAAIVFAVADLVGDYAPFLAITVVWAALGCLNLIVAAQKRQTEVREIRPGKSA